MSTEARNADSSVNSSEYPLPALMEGDDLSTAMLDLNDDCLMEIFRYLDLVDLYYVTEVCVRFKQCAQSLFPSKLKTFLIKRSSPQVLHSIIYNYGELVNELTLDEGHYFSVEIERLLESCVNLQKMHLWHIKVSDGEFLERGFAKLKSLDIKMVQGIKNKDFVSFLCQNPKLKHLSIEDGIGLTGQILEVIAKQSSIIKSIHFDQSQHGGFISQNHLNSLSLVENLQELKIGCNFRSIIEAIGKMADKMLPLQKLALRYHKPESGLFKAIADLKHLQCLEIHDYPITDTDLHILGNNLINIDTLILRSTGEITIDGVFQLITKINRLQSLTLRSVNQNISFSVDDYEKCLTILRQRPVKRCFHLCLENSFQSTVPNDVAKKNENELFLSYNYDHEIASIYSDSDDSFINLD